MTMQRDGWALDGIKVLAIFIQQGPLGQHRMSVAVALVALDADRSPSPLRGQQFELVVPLNSVVHAR